MLMALVSAMLTSCSSKEEVPQPDVNGDYIEMLGRGENAALYVRDSWDVYYSFDDGQTWDIKYQSSNPETYQDLMGFSSPGIHSIIIQDGMVLKEEELFHSTGPDPILACLEALRKSTGKQIEVYRGTSIDYRQGDDLSKLSGALGKVSVFNSEKLHLTLNGYGEVGFSKYISRSEIDYRAVPYKAVSMADNVIGSDLNDIRRQIIDRCREHFGRYIDLTEVYGGTVILDDGNIIDLDELEKRLLD